MKKKALIVGIDKYERLDHLKGCVSDATEIAATLRRPEYNYDVEMLIDTEVTRKAFRSAINTLLSNADISLLYFAGHGIRTTVSTFLATVDSEWDDEGVDLAYVTNAIDRISEHSQTIVVILDCCHAGSATVKPADRQFSPLTHSDLPYFGGTGRVIMAACLENQKAIESELAGTAHGKFTRHLLAALLGQAADTDKNVTVTAVYEHVATALAKSGNQRPMLRGDQSGRIILGCGIQPTTETHSRKATSLNDEIVSEAEEHVSRYFSALQASGLTEFESSGHRESSQRLSPIIDWFQRRISENNALLRNDRFRKCWNNALQQYQHLANISTGIVLDKNRKVGDFIGSGTFGSVWKICDPERVGICFKSYHATELRETEKAQRFVRGYRAMTQLDHPNVIRVFENTAVPLGFYMQFIDGPNLRQYSPANSCDLDTILDILIAVGETLSHAHGRNVLHRDVKPENILIEISGNGELRPYLTDFDLSWFSTATKLTKLAGDGFGSHFYAAPEQMNSPTSPAAHRPTVDAYSFGQVIFFAICGRDPAILDPSGNQRAFDERLSSFAVSERTARLLSAIYRDCTTKSPESRCADFRIICDRLSQSLTLCRSTSTVSSANQFLQELRFIVNGAISQPGAQELRGSVTLKSPSGRTDISLLIKKENSEELAFEAVVIPSQSPILDGGGDPATARRIVNQRIDSALERFSENDPKRTAPKSGAYQSIVNFAHISKDADGLSRCRELLMSVVNAVERG